MQPPNQHSRINLAELKSQIVKKLGPEGSKQYFHYLNRFLSLKLTKVEFSKLCLRIFGRDNLPLHNQFIRSILKSACSAKNPPSTTQKTRTGVLDRKTGDHHIGPNGKTSDFHLTKNGNLNPDDFNAVYSNNDHVVRDDGKDVYCRSPVQAPLGVPFCPVSIGGAHHRASSRFIGTYNDGYLLDSLNLREQMEQIAVGQGIEGVSVDCANILNLGLNSYLRGLISSCVQLVGARNNNNIINNTHKPLVSCTKLINGYYHQMQNNVKPLEVQEQRTRAPVSLRDFRVAMEMNPRQLGEDWPLLLEKICTHAFEE